MDQHGLVEGTRPWLALTFGSEETRYNWTPANSTNTTLSTQHFSDYSLQVLSPVSRLEGERLYPQTSFQLFGEEIQLRLADHTHAAHC